MYEASLCFGQQGPEGAGLAFENSSVLRHQDCDHAGARLSQSTGSFHSCPWSCSGTMKAQWLHAHQFRGSGEELQVCLGDMQRN